MISKIISGTISGINGFRVIVEVDVSQGLPSFDIVGLPNSSIKESKERVRTAIKNSKYQFPVKHITVNLAPADLKKEGSSFDLPIAAGLLACMNIIPIHKAENVFFSGELSLDGTVKPVAGILPMVHHGFKNGTRIFIVSIENVREASLVKGAIIVGVHSLLDVVKYFIDGRLCEADGDTFHYQPSIDYIDELDFSDVCGQEGVKRAFEIAAAGYHNVLAIGPPGSGKTMLAKRMPTILPPLDFDECLELTKIYSVAGSLKDNPDLMSRRPFRSPHHTISYSALTGGGRKNMPGELTLAHNGVLFLDELTEFNRNVLEVLRQPLEEHFITISRANGSTTYPASFMLVAAMNPCPCGFFGDDSDKCTCSTSEIDRYLSKISGPLLDRIDMHVEAVKINYSDLSKNDKSETSAVIRKRVETAHSIQGKRFLDDGIRFNSQMTVSMIEKYCLLGTSEKEFLEVIFDGLNFSARAYHKILKTARTIADLSGRENINVGDIAEASSYRSLDRKYWM